MLISMRRPNAGGVDHLKKVPFPFEMNREYDFRVVAKGNELSCYIDGSLINRTVHDLFTSGGVGLNMWHTTKARYRDLKIRHFNSP